MNLPAKIGANERLHHFGKYVIRMERQGETFVYEVQTRGGLFVSCGFDMTSGSEQEVVEGIVSRLGRGNPDRGYTVAV
jgi:hypothetical protein